jgi:acetyl esterase/lipase
MQRRQQVTTTTHCRRGFDAAVIMRPLVAVVALALIAVACRNGESASSGTTIETPSPEQSASSDATIETGVVYNENSRRQVLDVYVPAGDGPFPTIMAIHGGGFFSGSKSFYTRHAEYFVDSGIAFVAINYRLAPSTTHPGQVEDVHCALAWVHENADRYRLDPSHIVVMGGSSGGYLTGMLATVDDRDRYLTDCPHELPADPVAGAVPMFGIFDFTALDNDDYPTGLMGAASRLAGEPYNDLTPDVLAGMSAIERIDGSEPPILAIHGTRDLVIPSVMSERFVTALEAAGVDAELLLVEGPHAFDGQSFEVPPNGEVLAAIKQFVADVG